MAATGQLEARATAVYPNGTQLLVAHEDNLSLGVGAEVAASMAEDCFYDLDAPIVRVTMADIPAVPFAASMEQAALPDTKTLVDAMRKLASA